MDKFFKRYFFGMAVIIFIIICIILINTDVLFIDEQSMIDDIMIQFLYIDIIFISTIIVPYCIGYTFLDIYNKRKKGKK